MSESSKPLSSYKVIGFDVMGTLLDERAGIWQACKELHRNLEPSQTADYVADVFNESIKSRTESWSADVSYQSIMADAYADTVNVLKGPIFIQTREQRAVFAKSLEKWPAFPDTVAALMNLAATCDLVLLSNMDTFSLEAIVSRGALRGVPFSGFVGNDMSGAFKPNQRVNQILLDFARECCGVEQDQVLLVAQGLTSDHVPARDMGIASAWIDRYGHGRPAVVRAGVEPTWTFNSLQELLNQRQRGEQ